MTTCVLIIPYSTMAQYNIFWSRYFVVHKLHFGRVVCELKVFKMCMSKVEVTRYPEKFSSTTPLHHSSPF